MKTKHLLVSFVLGLGLAAALLWALNEAPLSAARAATSSTITVCLPADGPCDYADVQAAVDAAGEGDVIKVAAGTYTGASSRAGTTQAVYISKTVTIRGGYTTTNGFADPPDPDANPTTLDAQQQGRVLYVAGNVSPTVAGLRITGGDATGAGGIADSGGGVCAVSATLTISDSAIVGNVARYGGGLYLRRGEVTLSENAISANTANWVGGGLYAWDSEVVIEGNAILSNTAETMGGGMLLWSSEATIAGNVIAHNRVSSGISYSSGGGGVYLEDGCTATLINNVITENKVDVQGSGVYVDGSVAHMLHNTIVHNTAHNVTGEGTGVYVNVGFSPTVVVMTNTILANHGTGVYAETGTSVQLDGVLWYENTIANTAGGGTIAVTHAITGSPAFADAVYPHHLTAGSAAIDQGVSAVVTSDIDGDTRPMDGDVDGAAAADLGADEYWPCRARLNDDPTDYLTVQAAVDASTHPTDVVKVGGYCVGVEARAGATQTVYISKTLTIKGGYVTYDFAIPPDPAVNPTTLDAQQQGRVFYVAGPSTGSGQAANPTLEGLRITGGDASVAGGVADGGGGVCVVSATVTVSGSIVYSNTAGLVGGGLYLHESEATLTGNSILSNTAGASGGGMLLWASSAAIEGNVIAGNAANGEESWTGGGGVYLHGGSAAGLVNNAIVDNQVANQGGGLYVDGSSARLHHTTIARNGCTASIDGRGSGVYLGQGVSPTLVVMGNTILTNHGTGIYADIGTTARLHGVLWYDNTTANTAGAGTITVTHAITGTPAFAVDGYHLRPESAAIDQGTFTEVTFDIDGDVRPIRLLPDLGADEAPIWYYFPLAMRQAP